MWKRWAGEETVSTKVRQASVWLVSLSSFSICSFFNITLYQSILNVYLDPKLNGYIYIYTHIYLCMHTCTHANIHTYRHINIYQKIYKNICIYTYIHMNMLGNLGGGGTVSTKVRQAFVCLVSLSSFSLCGCFKNSTRTS